MRRLLRAAALLGPMMSLALLSPVALAADAPAEGNGTPAAATDAAAEAPRKNAYPEPSPYPISWELDFTHETPKRIVVSVPGRGEPRAYWYLPYKVVNNGDSEQAFLPRFELVTEDGRIHRSDRRIPAEVFNAIKRRERSRYLESPVSVLGEIRLGEDEARESVAIWQEPQRDMGNFTIYVTGLSGEFVEMKRPDGKPLTDSKGNPIILRKTLQLKYHVAGDEVFAGEDVVSVGEAGGTGRDAKRWVMR